MKVRTRFAPSPTGFLHVGGVRTALFSWLYAKKHKGEFVLRIEDTDQERSTQESVQAILQGMEWLGLDFDKGPYYQTERYPRYLAIAEQLLAKGQAYRCYCSKERLENLRAQQMEAKEKPRYDEHCREKNLTQTDQPHVIRFKNPKEGGVTFHDHVYGEIHVSNSELDDLILIRSDGNPTYNFAVVIDDWDMEITHVIRGDDHINNTPRQINLFAALGAPIPEFAHLPMILGDDGKRLSKRHGAVSVLQFKEMGILPHALLNYLVRLGWSYGDKEIFSVAEMTELFDLQNVSRGTSSFNYEKLYWLNQHYQKNDNPKEVAKALQWYFEQEGIDLKNGPALEDLVPIQAERCKTLRELCEKSRYFFIDPLEYEEEAVKKHLRPVILEPLESLLSCFKELQTWDRDHLQSCINDVSASFDMNMGKIAQPLRVAVTGGSNSPSIDMTLTLLGKERVLTRLQKGIEMVRNRKAEAL
ncbi:glutamyl-tRNA synthetase, catalytic subunit (plasmid) [Legionella adelaidensis]|uniref:Glutamate--tRNA ligase n=1 Tax=Legionella adelaidensis TaxID=45056 RepID=A0A0W0R325_9GAMM|nr:glutamate--tRNA ligase [Legionella adelaidensis]KTC65478.1 glutamyl-tRNA synthetase, catalytic subunit [Legionella adelaidensis]VEH84701.1 glutamyl-tRNA synthetase, catalytic subunit [Legionella adelaidensis]